LQKISRFRDHFSYQNFVSYSSGASWWLRTPNKNIKYPDNKTGARRVYGDGGIGQVNIYTYLAQYVGIVPALSIELP